VLLLTALSFSERARKTNILLLQWSMVDQLAELRALQQQIDRLLLEFSRKTAELVSEGGLAWTCDDIRIECKLTSIEVANRLSVGRQLETLAASVSALGAGKIGFGHLVKLARSAVALGQGFDEAAMLKLAEKHSVGRFHHICEHARHAARPQQVADEQAQAIERRRLELNRLEDGMYSIQGLLDGFGGAVLRNALEPLARPCGGTDERGREQRLADALVELAEGRQPAQLNVTVAAETLLGAAGAPGGEVEFAPPVCSPILERLRCDSVLRRVVLDDRSVVIDVGRGRRIVSDPMRKALAARDQGCVIPGCDRPVRYCSSHHLDAWSEGGGTSVQRSVLLCYWHHHKIHIGGWRLAVMPDGSMSVIKPPPRVSYLPYATATASSA
jgi:hypothetical protein